jgi:hypothetical protein
MKGMHFKAAEVKGRSLSAIFADLKGEDDAEAEVGEEWAGSFGAGVGVHGDDVQLQAVPGERAVDCTS